MLASAPAIDGWRRTTISAGLDADTLIAAANAMVTKYTERGRID